MHSFHQSRGRIFFEVLCALAVSVSCVGTWMQTGATAMLPGAAAALLYGLVHLFDMVRRRPVAPKAEAVEAVAVQPAEPKSDPMPVVPMVAAEQPVMDAPVAEAAPEAAELAPPVRKARQPKAPRKKAKVAKAEPSEEVMVVVADKEPAPELPTPFEEEHHASVTPLFEPVPFARQPRMGFGRKAGLAFRR